jgi:hypothetical protein
MLLLLNNGVFGVSTWGGPDPRRTTAVEQESRTSKV